METIEFNEVIKQNIEVVGELLPEATTASKGLMSKEDKRASLIFMMPDK